MLIKLLKTLTKTLFILLLVLMLIGLTLPQNYSVNKSVLIDAKVATVKSLVADFSLWHLWSPWQKVDPTITFSIGEPSRGIGAHQSWQNDWGHGEMTITSLTNNQMTFNALLKNEHIIEGTITFTKENGFVKVACNIKGQTTTPLVSGYLSLFSEYVLSNTVALGLNNLQTVAQLRDEKTQLESYDSEISPSKN
ncbi:SRPBCC family protein [Pseudoalteromonas espejiana]